MTFSIREVDVSVGGDGNPFGAGEGGGFVATDGQRLPAPRVPVGRRLIYGVRPEAITLGGDIPLTIEVTEPTGAETYVAGKLGGAPVTCVFRDRVTARPGEVIQIAIDPSAIHLFDAESGVRLTD